MKGSNVADKDRILPVDINIPQFLLPKPLHCQCLFLCRQFITAANLASTLWRQLGEMILNFNFVTYADVYEPSRKPWVQNTI
ncbi:hypothetical protein C2S52_010815 [Perilla frutescens var. hirtella]|nr:hypothetical protein C2S52_010815 [Perilla frutescens var. hirtella]